MDSGKDSVDLLKKLFDRFGARLNYVLVLNQLRGENFDLFHRSGEDERAQKLNARIVSLKRLHENDHYKLTPPARVSGRPPTAAKPIPTALALLERHRVKLWLRSAYDQIDKLEI